MPTGGVMSACATPMRPLNDGSATNTVAPLPLPHRHAGHVLGDAADAGHLDPEQRAGVLRPLALLVAAGRGDVHLVVVRAAEDHARHVLDAGDNDAPEL